MTGALRGIVAWWPWFAGALLALGVAAVLWRRRLRFYVRIAKALARDPRLPRPLRWLIGVGLVAKAMPVDFGVDEIALGIAALLLATRYRAVVRAVVAEQRPGPEPAPVRP